jgi:hypothetical protein
MGFLRKTLLLGTAGLAPVKANSKKERTAKAAEKQVRLQQQAMRTARPAARPAAQPAKPSTASELERLAGLHASGALTDAEFAAAKAKSLGG